MKSRWYVLIVAVVLLQLSGVRSQPPTPAPPEIHAKHFLYGYPLGTPRPTTLSSGTATP
jgi:hypothetical protein